jgi:hypothetical protein
MRIGVKPYGISYIIIKIDASKPGEKSVGVGVIEAKRYSN